MRPASLSIALKVVMFCKMGIDSTSVEAEETSEAKRGSKQTQRGVG
jgi:hypothetical protein